MKDENALLPCPFCGSVDLGYTSVRDCIQCNDCQCEGPADPRGFLLNEEYAIQAWNDRAETKGADFINEMGGGTLDPLAGTPDGVAG